MEDDDAGEIPIIIYRFLELYSQFVQSGETFDLREILRYKLISDQPVVFGDLKQDLDENGMASIDGASHATFKDLSRSSGLFNLIERF